MLALGLLGSCKKGEDDPMLSLRTRRARMEGDWRLEKATVTITTVDFANAARLNDVFQISNSKATLTETGPGITANTYTGAYFLHFKCNSDGTYTISEQLGVKNISYGGSWAFNSKSGSEKNKESATFRITDVSTGVTSGIFLFNQSATNFTYHIRELRNKKLVLNVGSTIYENATSSYRQQMSGEFTFIQ